MKRVVRILVRALRTARRLTYPLGFSLKFWYDANIQIRKVASENSVSPFRILLEQILLIKDPPYIDPSSYYTHRLYNPDLTWEEKKSFLVDNGKAEVSLYSLLEPKEYRGLYANKFIFNRFFSSLGFPLPKLYGIYDPVFGHTIENRNLRDAQDFRGWMQTTGVQEFVIKPVLGFQGRKTLIFVARSADDSNKLETLDGNTYDMERLVAFAKAVSRPNLIPPSVFANSYIIEQRIRQHPKLIALIGHTLCCVRV